MTEYLLGILTILIIAKLAGIIAWSWWIVFIPAYPIILVAMWLFWILRQFR